jgi:hypothetical protein
MASRQNIWPFGDSTKTVTVYRRRGMSSTGLKYKGYRVWEDGDGWHTSLDPGSWFDTKKDVTRFIDSWEKSRANPSTRFSGYHPNPPRGWFERCVAAVKAKGGAYDPNAVCAVQERRRRNVLPTAVLGVPGYLKDSEKWLKKHGVMRKGNPNRRKGRGNPMSKRRKRNPEAESAAGFEAFHGYPASEQITVEKDVHFHGHLWAVGVLEKLVVLAPDGIEVKLDGFEGATLAANEANTQLFIEGGDQSVDLESFGLGEPYHDKEDLGEVVKIFYFADKHHLGDQGGEAVYHHKFGEEKTKRSYEFGKHQGRRVPRPRLAYDTVNQSLEFIGGEYLIQPEGIRN